MTDGASSRLPLDWIAAALRRERVVRAGLSLSELAKRAGIAKSTLSQLEAAGGNPSMETLWALAVALGVPFSALVEPPAPRVQVIRAGEGPTVRSDRSSYVATLLSASPRRAARPLRGGPGAGDGAGLGPAHAGDGGARRGERGTVSAGPEGEEVELGVGDYMAYRGDVPHRYEALEPGTKFVLIMQHV